MENDKRRRKKEVKKKIDEELRVVPINSFLWNLYVFGTTQLSVFLFFCLSL